MSEQSSVRPPVEGNLNDMEAGGDEQDSSESGGRGRVNEQEEKEMWDAAFGEEEEEEREIDMEDSSKEGMRARVVRAGHAPTDREVEEHVVNHLPFRSWCRHCVKGKARSLPHRVRSAEDKKEESLPVVSIDYMFMHDKQK